MLYDPKWEVSVKADPFSFESLIDWLEKQPADKQYDYNNCSGACLLDQYGDAMGMPDTIHRYRKLADAFDVNYDRPAHPRIALGEPRTFGAALTRARAALAAR